MDDRNRVTGVLLAGGQSRRMGGGDKSLLPLGGVAMLSHVIERLRPQVGWLVLNANGDPSRFAGFGLPVVADTLEGFAGPLAGVLAGMRWSEREAPEARWIVTAASDTPFLPRDLVARFITAATGADRVIVLARSAGRTHPVFGLWPVALADDLEAALAAGTRKILAWTERHDTRLADFAFAQFGERQVDPFFNANTPEELAQARALLSSAMGSGDLP
jgi:molybdopterin-guanine dinucleotide biosynthesis protein A